MATVQPGSFLTLHYRLAGPAGDIINTFDGKPATLSLGAGELSPAVENLLLGLPEGAHTSFEAVQWLQQPTAVASLALLPLRRSMTSPAFGMLVLASPDPMRYTPEMGTDFLVRIAELASAAVTRLLPDGG